jgi:hypothetical protein
MVENQTQLRWNLVEKMALRLAMKYFVFQDIVEVGDWNRNHPEYKITKEDIENYGKVV